MRVLTAIWYCRIRRTPAMKYRRFHSLEDCSTAIAEFGKPHNFPRIPFITQQVAQISHRATSAKILVKRGTESRFWALVGILRKWKNCRLRFVVFMLYWGRVLASAFWGKKNFCTLLCDKIPVQIFFRAELSFAEPKVLCVWVQQKISYKTWVLFAVFSFRSIKQFSDLLPPQKISIVEFFQPPCFVDAGGADADNGLSRHLSVFSVLMTHGFRAPQGSIVHIKLPPFFRCFDAGKSTWKTDVPALGDARVHRFHNNLLFKVFCFFDFQNHLYVVGKSQIAKKSLTQSIFHNCPAGSGGSV